eukprot:GDKH01008705.1.p1 GENE.GDKH01008705.1~~GDKH01008705.1.p1  ORF type:complete len:357 (-),score=59.63 GDKH01008705.1:364-1434(-)
MPRRRPGVAARVNSVVTDGPYLDDDDVSCFSDVADEGVAGTGRYRRVSLSCPKEVLADVLHGRNLDPFRDRTFRPSTALAFAAASVVAGDITPSALQHALDGLPYSAFVPGDAERSVGASSGMRSPSVARTRPRRLPLHTANSGPLPSPPGDVTPPRIMCRLTSGVSHFADAHTGRASAATTSVPSPPRKTAPEEMRELAATLVGRWVTDVKASDLYEPVLARMGVSWVRRRIMNSYPILIESAADATNHDLFNIVATVMGVRKQLVWRLDGAQFGIEDSDTGKWDCECRPVDFEFNGAVTRALQQVRLGPSGRVEETRRVFNKPGMGDVMHIHIAMWPSKGPEELIVVNRYCRKQ